MDGRMAQRGINLSRAAQRAKMAPEEGQHTKSKSAAAAAAKTKPSYKHVPHSQKPAHLVAKRNARERRRVQAVNQAFYRLRRCVPIENRNKRVSKVKTLQRAIDYIRKLERILESDEAPGELLVLGDGTVLSAPGAHKQANNNNGSAANNCDARPRQRRPRKSKAPAAQLGPAGAAGAAAAQPAPEPGFDAATGAAAAAPAAPEPAPQGQPDYYGLQSASELVLRESSAFNSNLYYHQEPATYLAAGPYQAAASSVGEQPFGGGGGGGGNDYSGAYYYHYQQQQQPHPEQQQPSGGWRNKPAEVAPFGAQVAPSPANSSPDELSSPAAAPKLRQQVNTAGYHLSFAADDNYQQQQQLDGGQPHDNQHQSADANCLPPIASLHEHHHQHQHHHHHQQHQQHQQYQRHFPLASQQPAANNLLQQQEYGAAI